MRDLKGGANRVGKTVIAVGDPRDVQRTDQPISKT